MHQPQSRVYLPTKKEDKVNKHSALQEVLFDATEREHKGEDERIRTGTPTPLHSPKHKRVC